MTDKYCLTVTALTKFEGETIDETNLTIDLNITLASIKSTISTTVNEVRKSLKNFELVNSTKLSETYEIESEGLLFKSLTFKWHKLPPTL